MSGLAAAQLAICAILAPPSIYCLITHGKRGLLTWFYVNAFLTMRTVGSALQIKAESSNTINTTATILSSMGMSPLLLAAIGLLHEARSARTIQTREWPIITIFHLIVSTSIALLGVGASKVISGNSTHKDLVLMKVGVAGLLISWILLVLWAFITLRQNVDSKLRSFGDGTKLFYTVLATLPFIGMRVIYTVVVVLGDQPNFGANVDQGVKIGLSIFPELFAITIITIIGIVTRKIASQRGMEELDKEGVRHGV